MASPSSSPPFPDRSPEQDLAEALGTLQRLNETYSRSTRVATLIDILEADITYSLQPDMLVAHPKVTR